MGDSTRTYLAGKRTERSQVVWIDVLIARTSKHCSAVKYHHVTKKRFVVFVHQVVHITFFLFLNSKTIILFLFEANTECVSFTMTKQELTTARPHTKPLKTEMRERKEREKERYEAVRFFITTSMFMVADKRFVIQTTLTLSFTQNICVNLTARTLTLLLLSEHELVWDERKRNNGSSTWRHLATTFQERRN